MSKKLIKAAVRYRYNKCSWIDFTTLIKNTLIAVGKKPTDERVRAVALRAMKAAKALIEG